MLWWRPRLYLCVWPLCFQSLSQPSWRSALGVLPELLQAGRQQIQKRG